MICIAFCSPASEHLCHSQRGDRRGDAARPQPGASHTVIKGSGIHSTFRKTWVKFLMQ